MAPDVNAPLYTVEILRLAASLPDSQRLDRVDGSASSRSHTCGSSVQTDVQLTGGRIAALSQTVSACAFGQASSALVARHAAGRDKKQVEEALADLSAWLAGNRDDPPDWPGYQALAAARGRTGRNGAILLPLQALLAAIESAS